MNQNNIYQYYTETAEDQELITGEAVSLSVQPASFLMRTLGALIDMVVSIAVLLAFVFSITEFALVNNLDPAAIQALSITTLVFSFVILPVAIETLSRGRSLGKLIIGARIVRDDGGSIQFRHALIRGLIGFFEIWMTAGGGAAVAGLLSSKTKRLGDMLAGTYSQNERIKNPFKAPDIMMPQELTEWAARVDVGRVPEVLLRRVHNFLRSSAQLLPGPRMQHAALLQSEIRPYVSEVPHANPEAFLAAVTVLRRNRDYAYLQINREKIAILDPILASNPHQFPHGS